VADIQQISPEVRSGAPVGILPADLRDLFEVWALERACFGPDAWGLVELTFTLLAPSIRLKAVAGGRLVGFGVGEPRPWSQEAWIVTIGVHPGLQRRGIGRKLLAAVEARLKPATLRLTVRESNLGAQALYAQFGYRPVQRIARYYSGGETGIVMEKLR
jgi:ribosomal protein S18 acetylase RimI-like enzyme